MEADRIPMAVMIPELEYRHVELRRDGDTRSVSGTVVQYSDVADIGGMFRERILQHALRAEDAILNLYHDRRRPLARQGGALRFIDGNGRLELRADVVKTPTGDEALALVEAGIVRGFSVEMRVHRDAWEPDGETQLRTVLDATMTGVALVDRPAYPQSSVDRWKAATAAGRPYRWHTYL